MTKLNENLIKQITELAEEGSSTVNVHGAKLLNVGTPTSQTDGASKGYVDDVSAIKGIGVLRNSPNLTSAGFVTLAYHTIASYGGGNLYWDAASTETDDNGTIFQIAGVPTGRWKRTKERLVTVDDFGAVPNYNPATNIGVDSTAAIQAAASWVRADAKNRPLIFGEGCYKLTTSIVAWHQWTIRGVSKTQTRIWFVSSGDDCIDIGIFHDPITNYQIYNVTIKDLWICGGANCGRSALYLPVEILMFDIDIFCTGGFQYGFYCNQPDVNLGGALQWGSISMSSIISQVDIGYPNNYIFPTNYFYLNGYINACKIHMEVWASTGTAITMIGNYEGANYSELYGTTQGCGKSLELVDCGALHIHDFYSETDGTGTVTRSSIQCDHGACNLDLINSSNCRFSHWSGTLTEDGYTYGTVLDGTSYEYTKTNLSAIGTDVVRNYGAGGNRFDNALGGLVDPQNIWMNGAFERWVAGNNPAGYTDIGNFTATKCGIGCVDTTRTENAPNCALFSPGLAPNIFVISKEGAFPKLLPQHLNSHLVLSFKAKRKSGTGTLSYALSPANINTAGAATGHIIACENGFELYENAARITQEHIDNWLMLIFNASNVSEWYISEVSISIGVNQARHFSRCEEDVGTGTKLLPNGSIEFRVTTTPVATTDPIFGQNWLDGDIAKLDVPTLTNGVLQTGWIRQNSDWRPLADTVNLTWFGAKGDGYADDTAAFASALTYLQSLNRRTTLFIPAGRYKVVPTNANYAGIWVNFDGLRITGEGDASEIFVTGNSHVPIHVSTQQNLTVAPSTTIQDFECDHIKVTGTGTYQYYAMAFGRGILIRAGIRINIHNTTVVGMSMIGICTEGGNGYFRVYDNIVTNCKFTAINFNGRCYNSIVRGNIISGTDGDINAVAIQVDGPCIVTGNTIYGHATNYANAGGIMFGEGSWDGIGEITHNYISHTRYGIKSIYHGACNISSNILVNCLSTGGIQTIGGTSSFTVETTHQIISNNLIINCYPYQIEAGTVDTLVSGNICRKISSPTLPSALSEPDGIIVATAEAGIILENARISCIGNIVDGAQRGLITLIEYEPGIICGNTIRNCAVDNYAQSTIDYVYISVPNFERVNISGDVFVNNITSPNLPTMGFYPVGSRWKSSTPVSNVIDYNLINSQKLTVAILAGGLSSTVTLNTTVVPRAGDTTYVGIILDNNTFHWTSVTAVSGAVITLASTIPSGRSAIIGAKVYIIEWAPFSTIVTNVTSLRKRPNLIAYGSCHLACHTTDGYGGGPLYWDGYSTVADNNIDTFQVTGVTTGRWKRSSENYSGITMVGGTANLGGFPLTNFFNQKTEYTAVAGGAAFTEVAQISPGLTSYQVANIGIRVLAYETSRAVMGYADCEVCIYHNGTTVAIQGTPIWDKISKGFPSTFDVSVSVVGSYLSVKVKPGSNNSKCCVYSWWQPAVELV